MKLKLQELFGDRIIHTEINGKSNVVTFRNKAEAVLHDFYSHQKADPDAEKRTIVETAAKLIRDDIKAVKTPIHLLMSWGPMNASTSYLTP